MNKLSVINNALAATGNMRVNALYDPSDEYQIADLAFDRAIKTLVARHSWPFATTVEELVRAPDADNKSRTFRISAFRIPTAAFHVKEIFWHEYPLTDYEILDQLVCCDKTEGVYAKIVRNDDTARWHPMAEEVLTLMVEAGCLRGLNEDSREALNVDRKVEGLLMEVRAHVDQQNPARNLYKSSIAAARRARRG